MLQQFKADLFKALAHPVRIRVLELLRDGERSVTELQMQLEVEQSTVSQQLMVLRSRNIVQARKEGSSVYYKVRDPKVFELLDTARLIFDNHLINLQSIAAAEEGNNAIQRASREEEEAGTSGGAGETG